MTPIALLSSRYGGTIKLYLKNNPGHYCQMLVLKSGIISSLNGSSRLCGENFRIWSIGARGAGNLVFLSFRRGEIDALFGGVDEMLWIGVSELLVAVGEETRARTAAGENSGRDVSALSFFDTGRIVVTGSGSPPDGVK